MTVPQQSVVFEIEWSPAGRLRRALVVAVVALAIGGAIALSLKFPTLATAWGIASVAGLVAGLRLFFTADRVDFPRASFRLIGGLVLMVGATAAGVQCLLAVAAAIAGD